MICTTGSFLKKLLQPGVDPARVSFFMPEHTGPCRFGQYNHLQRIIFDKLGYEKAEIVSPSNESSYADVAGKDAPKFRFNAWKGFIAVDFLRKLKQEIQPYELHSGDTDRVYQRSLNRIKPAEKGTAGLHHVLKEITGDFLSVPVDKRIRKPVVAVVGEIFMRDNSFCNGGLIRRLEEQGVETLVAPFSEWLTYSTYRYTRDSIWKRNPGGYMKSKFQNIAQHLSEEYLLRNVIRETDHAKNVPLSAILGLCNTYVHRDYDGDPPIAMGTSVYLASHDLELRHTALRCRHPDAAGAIHRGSITCPGST
jgi:predicted nucleotide-binding protein (sugar kinase/HSP70/actin superfamily)